MLPRLLTIWESVRTSLWAVPVAMIALAVATAIVAMKIRLDIGADPAWFLYSGNAKDAPSFLSALVTSMITLATLAISITMVVLTLAAQQLGPRLIRIFMGDIRTQLTLGLFTASVVYLLLILRRVYGAGDEAPNLAVTIGTFLVLLSAVSLLLFVHHLARSIIADTVIESVGCDIDEQATQMLPERTDEDARAADELSGESAPLRTHRQGYIQAIDHNEIVEAATQANAVIVLDVRAGHLVLDNMVIGKTVPASAGASDLSRRVETAIIVGRERTPVQDLEFAIRQMVEIAVRALSPGVNDPFTAMAAIDRLAMSLSRIMQRGEAQSVWRDRKGRMRLVVPTSRFDGLMDAAFNMIRQNGSGSPAILIRLAERLMDLRGLANETQRQAIERHLAMIWREGRRSIDERADLEALKERIAPSGLTAA
ncbi:DUF2254 domain-containing protein [Pseudorhodoplanes sp.]|uniref:DUF2254 domain-containing protein n=1 Tax=Pseudorhodoplanes sp. TaxID=1934341 RepID=UPI00391D2F8C